MRLRYLHLSHYPPLADLAVAFSPRAPWATFEPQGAPARLAIHFVIGQNGSGKSHLLRALAEGFLALADERLPRSPLSLVYELGRPGEPGHRTLIFDCPGEAHATTLWQAEGWAFPDTEDREAFAQAAEYMKKKEAGEDVPLNVKWEALIPVLKRELPVNIHAHRSDDMITAIRLAKEFNLDLKIIHCTDGKIAGKYMAEAGIEGIVGPGMAPSQKQENVNVSMGTPASMYRDGVKICITTDHDVIPLWYLPVCAAVAVREGLPEEEALKAITINAAQIAGISDRVGSLEVGKDADISVFTGFPLDFRASARAVFIDGEQVV